MIKIPGSINRTQMGYETQSTCEQLWVGPMNSHFIVFIWKEKLLTRTALSGNVCKRPIVPLASQ